jgi:hypothetical protein
VRAGRRIVDDVDNRSEVRDFLTSRRARLTPKDAGLPALGAARRVKGLRREEVATLAGVSVEYYNRMERGGLRPGADHHRLHRRVGEPVERSTPRASQLGRNRSGRPATRCEYAR